MRESSTDVQRRSNRSGGPGAGWLSPWEQATIEIFVRGANLIGLPRSIGEIYGLLFCAEKPLSFEELLGRLGISKGSVSQGLKLLRQLGAVKVQYVAGSRRDHYVPELSMKRLVQGFIRDQFSPHIESGNERLRQARELAEEESDPDLRQHALDRLNTLTTWQKRTRQLMPAAQAVLGGVDLLGGSRGQDEEEVV